jgi:hypothetical protein
MVPCNTMKTDAHKGTARRNPQRVLARNQQIGVTREASVARPVPKTKDRRDDRPRACCRRLKPWLDLANRDASELYGDDAGLPSVYISDPSLSGALQDSLATSFETLCRNAQWIRGLLRDQEKGKAPRWPGGPNSGLAIDAGEWNFGPLWKETLRDNYVEFRFDFATKRLRPNLSNLREGFRRTVLDTELLRFRQCPECSHFFYAIRTDQETCGGANCRKKRQRSRDATLARQVFELFDAGKTDAQVRPALLQTRRTLPTGRLKQLRREWRSRQSRRSTSSMKHTDTTPV